MDFLKRCRLNCPRSIAQLDRPVQNEIAWSRRAAAHHYHASVQRGRKSGCVRLGGGGDDLIQRRPRCKDTACRRWILGRQLGQDRRTNQTLSAILWVAIVQEFWGPYSARGWVR